MAAIVQMNKIPIIQWKGQTFEQIHSLIKKNDLKNYTIDDSSNIKFRANPLKIYRREVATADTTTCNPRTSTSIDIFNQPNGTIINSSATTKNGLVNTVDNNIPNDSCDTNEYCSVILSPEQKAKNRVRSSGMIRKKNNITTPLQNYYTNTKQYLESRSLNFEKNQYNFLQSGDSTADPGSSLAFSNTYTTNGTNSCKKDVYYKPSNYLFANQGAVTSSDLILRKKYNSITNSAVLYRNAVGQSVGNALAYGVPLGGYTVKDKIGFPLKKTPTFSKHTDEMKKCEVRTIKNQI
tara:strand:- start:8853 stop:9731 length:879 start_codon:yes stop_codon:yes gene_type:complete